MIRIKIPNLTVGMNLIALTRSARLNIIIACKYKKCAAGAAHEKRIASIAATQFSYWFPKYAKMKPAFLPNVKIHTLRNHEIYNCVAPTV